MKQQYILFDLDGTLTDPMLGITKSVRYALAYYGIKVSNLEQLCPFIGPPLKDSFMNYYQFSETQARAAVLKYREYFSSIGIYENQVYPGVEQMLARLREAGKRLMLATSKPEIFAKQIMEHFSLHSYFEFIGGGTLDGRREEKADIIRYVLETNNLWDKTDIIMVGDRQYDVLGAHQLGIKAIGVVCGYGGQAELVSSGADYIVNDIVSLEKLLTGIGN